MIKYIVQGKYIIYYNINILNILIIQGRDAWRVKTFDETRQDFLMTLTLEQGQVTAEEALNRKHSV